MAAQLRLNGRPLRVSQNRVRRLLANEDIAFVYYHDQPAFFSPGTRIEDPGLYSTVSALNRIDLAAALGPAIADRAEPVAWDPAGRPAVWAVSP